MESQGLFMSKVKRFAKVEGGDAGRGDERRTIGPFIGPMRKRQKGESAVGRGK